MAYYMAVLLDESRLEAVKGSGLEKKVEPMFGGALNSFILEIPENKSKQILSEFEDARIDARGFLEDLPIAFKKAVFEEIVKEKSLGPEAIDGALNRASEIKEAAAKESEYLPPPEV